VVDFLPKVKIEIVLNDDLLRKAAIEAIRRPRRRAGSAMARFLSSTVEEAIRIRTGETGGRDLKNTG
jgi:nitrogen regulatory protein P-II 1